MKCARHLVRGGVLTLCVVATTLTSSAAAPARFVGQEEAVPVEGPDVDAYQALLDVGFDANAAVRVENLEISRGAMVLNLESGTWLPMSPVSDRVTGGVFFGDGTITYTPPDATEEAQVEKFTDETLVDAEEFERLYFRFTDDTDEASFRRPPTVTDETATRTSVEVVAADRDLVDDAEDWHRDITEHFLEEERTDIDSRVYADLIEGGGEFFTVWIDTNDDGPLQFTHDDEAWDLYRLRGWKNRERMFDVWSGYGEVPQAAALPRHYTIDMTLDGGDLEEATAELTLEARRTVRALRFEAHPLLEIAEVLDAEGEPLFFARREAEDDEFEDMLTVVLPEPLAAGAETTLTFKYEGEIIDTPWGGGEYAIKVPDSWYPTLGYLQRATYDLTFRVDDGHKVFAAGVQTSDEIEDGRRIVRFEQVLPVAFVSFNYGPMPTRVVEVEGAPPVTVFGNATGLGGDALGNVGSDVGNSLAFFSEIYGSYPFSYMSATMIPYAHGQGFPGLLHLASGSFGNERRGHTELFRGHETAHQWWGHIVGWASYRDQWISEGFAEYSGALYASTYLEDPELLDEITGAWRNDIFNRGNAGFNVFGLDAAIVQRYSDGSASGPVTLGQRLSSTETPVDYALLAYEKGAFILHMLRMAMYDWDTNTDEPWREMMRDFVASHAGSAATTESFRAVTERHFGEDMGWFFDQWVYGTTLPRYVYAWKNETAIDGQRSLRLRVRQGSKPEEDELMRAFVPVWVDLGEDRYVVLRVLVDESYEEFSFDLPGGLTPEEVVLNPRNAVLAEVEKEDWRR